MARFKRGGADQGETSSSAEYGKTASFLAIGVGLTGVITYAYFLIASHTLSKLDYGQITILWSAVFITISTLYRPVEQLLSRHISERLVNRESISQPMRVAATIQVGLALTFAVAALALRGPLEDDLLDGNEPLYWVFFGAVLFYAASYFARGYLAGRREFGPFTALILSESVFRTSFAVLVAVGLLSGQDMVAVGIVAAPSLSLIVVPVFFAWRAKKAKNEPPAPVAEDAPDEAFSMKEGSGFAAAVLVIMFSEQAFLNAGPLIIGALSGATATGFIFNVLMIARAPLQLFQAVSTSILPHLTSLHTSTEPDSEREFHRSVRGVLLGIAGFAAFTAVVVLIAGPKLMEIAFSGKYEYDRPALLLVTLGMGLYLGAVTLNQACLAQGQVRRAAGRWIGCATFFIAWTLVPLIADEFRRVEIGFALTAGILFGLLYLVYRNPHERPEDVPEPGSPEELEARLASIDENV
ncbi:MAG TPA: lipopolysaccharide biosynthesis protein [Solirubrobacterales bacterium]|nr:lipopolysaccharide biosynthesis protein [Solirubrobacterales bacterium]